MRYIYEKGSGEKMLSFKVLTEDNIEEVVASLVPTNEMYSDFSELAHSLDLLLDDVEFALSFAHGCALVRVFDMGRYSFLYPFSMTDEADDASALSDIAEYAMREEIRLVVDDVPRECICNFLSFRHIDVDASGRAGDSFRVTVKTECELMGEVPEVELGRVMLNALTEEDIPEYARLCRDKGVNKHWGYDYYADVTDPEDAYFYEMAMSELAVGVALSMAVRHAGSFIGEAVLYAFDGRGCAEFAIRLLPEWQGVGLGGESVRAICDAAYEIGLIRLSSAVMKENIASVRMLKKLTDKYSETDNGFVFYIDL